MKYYTSVGGTKKSAAFASIARYTNINCRTCPWIIFRYPFLIILIHVDVDSWYVALIIWGTKNELVLYGSLNKPNQNMEGKRHPEISAK